MKKYNLSTKKIDRPKSQSILYRAETEEKTDDSLEQKNKRRKLIYQLETENNNLKLTIVQYEKIFKFLTDNYVPFNVEDTIVNKEKENGLCSFESTIEELNEIQ
jgi:hypothetical protein